MFKSSYTSFLSKKHHQETLIFQAADPFIIWLLMYFLRIILVAMNLRA